VLPTDGGHHKIFDAVAQQISSIHAHCRIAGRHLDPRRARNQCLVLEGSVVLVDPKVVGRRSSEMKMSASRSPLKSAQMAPSSR